MNITPLWTALACLAVHAQAALGQPSIFSESRVAKRMAPDELKRAYLACDAMASSNRLHPSDAIQCSFVAEELKLRVFEGDFDKLLAWWRVNRYTLEEKLAEE